LEEALKKGALVEKALHLKKEGVIRFLGFSSHGPTSTIIKAIQTGVFDYVNLWYSYINQTNWPAIQEAQKQDMGVFIISPNDKGGRLYDPPEKLCRLCAPLSPMTFNDIFILSHPEIHTISCGAQRPEDLDKHVSAVARMDTLQDTVTEIRQRLDQTLESVIDKEWAHNYTQGLPDWSDTPGHINIPAILWLWNLVKAFDLTEYAKFRFNLMGNAEHWFPGAKPEVFATIDPHELRKALANSPYTDRIMDILKEAHEMFKSDKGKRLGSE
jgi:predicted aldo/keto reductase-like oxidoreductase